MKYIMCSDDVKKHIGSLCSHITFEWNNKECGIDPLALDEFDMWYGEKTMTAKSIEEVMTADFFDGYSLENILDDAINIEPYI